MYMPNNTYEVLGSSTNDLERSGLVNSEHGFPLLVVDLVKHAIVGVTSIVDNVIDLAESLDGFLNDLFGESRVHHVAGNRDGATTSSVDVSSNLIRLGYMQKEWCGWVNKTMPKHTITLLLRTSIKIGDSDKSTFTSKEFSSALTNTLTTPWVSCMPMKVYEMSCMRPYPEPVMIATSPAKRP